MRKQPKKIRIQVSEYFDFKNFEEHFLRREFHRKVRWKKEGELYRFDLTKTKWFDLMELMSLVISADYIFNKTGCKSEFTFFDPLAPGTASEQKLEKAVNFAKSMHFPESLLSKCIESNIEPESIIEDDRLLGMTTLDLYQFAELQNKIRDILNYYYSKWLSEIQIFSFVNRLIFETCENVLEHAYDKEQDNLHTSKLIAIRRFGAAIKPKSMEKRAKYSAYWIREMQRLYPKKEILEVVIADGGVGIEKRLGQAFQKRVSEWTRKYQNREPTALEVSELECIKWALSEERSTSSKLELEKREKGYGLYIIKMYSTKGWGGCFYIRSGKSRAIYMNNDDDPVLENNKDLEFFPGVQIRLFLPIIDRKNEIQEVKELDDHLGEK